MFAIARRSLLLHHHHHHHHHLVAARSISSTVFRQQSVTGWIDKIKGVFTGSKPKPSDPLDSLSLIEFANQLDRARKLESLKNFRGGPPDVYTKQLAILRYLGSIDPSGEKISSSHKKDATKHCNCTIVDVENVLGKYKWAKEAQSKLNKLKEEGKPMPKSLKELQNLVGSKPTDFSNSNLGKSGQISRNGPCPCGSGKRYKRCCGETATT